MHGGPSMSREPVIDLVSYRDRSSDQKTDLVPLELGLKTQVSTYFVNCREDILFLTPS